MSEMPSQLFKRWTHSREEDSGDVMVFRPSSFSFPPSRGRDGLEFREDGEVLQYRIGATDRPEGVLGFWRAELGNRLTVDFPAGDGQPYRIQLISVDHDVLKIRREPR